MASQMSRQWMSAHGHKTLPDGTPVRIMQFGEGGFLRAFVDWIFKLLNDSGHFSGAVQVVQPIPHGMVDKLRAQEYAYTLLLRGMVDGVVKDEPYFIDVIRDGLNPYDEWARFLSSASAPDLRYIVSNTTEAGITYVKTDKPSACPESFPAKVAIMLDARCKAVSAAPEKGLVFLPCELIEKNGEMLKEAILRHLADWNLPETAEWVKKSCLFYNTLVDRIVTGYPAAEAEAIWKKLDCRDDLLDVGEYFHLWVIEGDQRLADEIPFAKCGLNVVVTDNLKPYRDRKVRVLNGAHTGNVLAAYLSGVDTVGEMMDDKDLGAFLRSMVSEEILPGVALPDADKRKYADAVCERFQNPFVRHELLSISLNSVSKWTVRVLPSVKDYITQKGTLPKRLAFSLAGLIAFYKGDWKGDAYTGLRNGKEYPIRDDKHVLDAMNAAWREDGANPEKLASRILSDTSLWGENLAEIPGLTASVSTSLKSIIDNGARAALRLI